jgi:PAS domain S-box-containing protein
MPAESTLELSLREAHRERIAAQLLNLGCVITGGSVVWFVLASIADAASVRAAAPLGVQAAIVVLQGLAFGTATALCRRDPTARAVTTIAVATCVVVGLVWVWVLTVTATMAAMVMFATLMLLGAAPLVLAWGLGPQLVFQGSLTIVWIGALVALPRHLPMSELATAIAFGNLIAFAATQWAAHGFRTEVLARFAALDFDRQIAASRDAYRALAENAVDFIWAMDLQGRWTYVNEALARRCGRTVEAMIGRPVGEILTSHPSQPDPARLIARAVAGEKVEPQTLQMAAVDGPCWVEAVATLVHGAGGEVIGIQGSSRDVTERRLAEEALRSSEERFRGIFGNAPVGMAVVAPDGTVLEVNRALATMLGYDEQEPIGMQVWDVLHPDDVLSVRRLVEAVLAGARDGFATECRHRHRDGHVVWNQLHVFLERDADGTPRRFISQVVDITDQRAAEAALRASERRFRSFAESMAAGVLIAENDGIAYVNDAVTTITGFSREELLTMQVWDFVHPDERAEARAKVSARLGGAQLLPRSVYRLATKSGEPRWVDVTVAILELEGTLVMLGTAFDVTERKLAEEALRASEARYRGLVESQREIVLRFDPSGCVTFANDAYCDTYGVRREDAEGKSFWPLVHPDDVERLRTAMAGMMGPPYRGDVEVRSRTVSGWRWFEWEASAIRDRRGTVIEGQAAGRDVTERRRAQDDLQASLEDLRRSEEKLRLLAQRQVAVREEERKRLSYDLHDDVCQELVVVAILIEAVLGRLVAAAPDAVDDLTRATRYVKEVVEHLRVLSRELRPMLLHDLGLEGSIRSLVTGLSNHATTVRAVFATDIPRLEEADEVTVYRIAQEAVSNAVRHASARSVTVTLSAADARLVLEVRDDGQGFDVAHAEPVHALGLASMEERAQALSGRFLVRSQRGKGTTITLDCPMHVRTSASAA